MTSNTSEKTKPIDLFARLCYFTDLFVHRRVLVVSDNPEPAEFLSRLNARYICTISDSPVAEAPGRGRGPIDFKSVDYSNMQFRDGMFDVAVVPNLSAIPNATELLNELRRVVGRRGHVIAASPNPTCEMPLTPQTSDSPESQIDYYQLYDVLSQSFESVQMIGQAPFLGYAVSDLAAEEDTAISFDGSMLESDAEEIEWFIAVCGEEPVNLDGYSIVQVPLSAVQLGDTEGAAETAMELERVQDENRELLIRNEELLKEADQLEEDLRILEDEMRLRTEAAKSAVSEEDLTTLKEELQRVKLEMGTRGVRIETLENDLEKERMEAEAARARAVQLAKQYDDERKAHQAQQIEAQMSKGPGPEVLASINELKAELNQAKVNLEATEKARDEIIERTRGDAQELQRLRMQIKELQKKESEFVKREDALGDKLATAHQELRKALAQAEDTAKTEELERALSRSEKKNQEQQAACDDLRNQLKDTQEKIKALEENATLDAEAYAEGNQRLESRLKELGASFAEAQKELERREALIRDLTVALSNNEQAETSASALEKQIADERQKIDELVSSLKERTERLAQKDDRIAALETQLRKQSEENQALRQRTEELQQVSEAKAAEEKAPNTSSDEIAVRDKRIARLESDLQASVWRSDELEARHADSAKSLQTARASLAATEARIQELEAIIDELKAEQAEQASRDAETADDTQPESAPSTTTDEEAAEAANKVALLETELAMAMGTLSGHHRARVEAELALSTLERSNQTIRQELDDAIVQNRTLEEELAAAMGTISGHHRGRVEAELEIATWQRQAQKSADELDDMVRKYRDLETALAEAAGMFEGHRRARLEAELTASAAEAKNEKLKARIASLQQRISELEDTVQHRDAALSENAQVQTNVTQELDALRKKHASLTESYEEILEAFKQAQKELRQHSADNSEQDQTAETLAKSTEELENLRTALRTREDEYQDLASDLAAQRNEVEQLRSKLVASDQQISWMKTELSNAETENQHLLGTLREKEGEQQELLKSFDALQTQRDELQNNNATLIREKETLEKDLHSATDESSRLRHDLGGADAELDKLRHQLGENHNELERVRGEIGISHGEVERLRHDLSGADAEIHRLREELGGKNNHIDGLENKLQQAESELHQLRDSVSGSNDNVNRLQEELRTAEDRIRTLTDELGTSRVETERARNEMSGTANELNELRNELASAVNETGQLSQALSDANAELDRLREEMQAVSSERDALRNSSEDKAHQLTIAMDDLRDRLKLEEERSRNAGADAARWAGKTEELKQALDSRMREFDNMRAARDATMQTLAVLRAELSDAEQSAHSNAAADENEINSLRAQLEEQQTQLTEFSNQLEEVTLARDSAVNALAVLRSTLDAQEHQNANAQSLNQDEIEQLKNRHAELSEQLAQKDDAIASLKNDLQAIESRSQSSEEEFERQLLHMQQDLQAAQLEQQGLQQKTELLQERLGQKEVQLSDTISRLETATSEADATAELNALVRQKDEELKAVKDELAEAQMEFAAKNLEISQARGNEKTANEKLERMRDQLEKARAVGPMGVDEDVLNDLADLKKKCQTQEGVISEMEERIRESQPLIDSLTDQLEQRERNVTKLEKKVRMLTGQLKETEGDSVAWDMELKFRDAKISALEDEINELRTRLK